MLTHRAQLLAFLDQHQALLDATPKAMLQLKTVRNLVKDVKTLFDMSRRKPRIVVVGVFNAGKSSFINALLGRQKGFPEQGVLPVDYIPCTKGPCIVRRATAEFPGGTVRIIIDGDGATEIKLGDYKLLQRGAHHEGDISGFKEIEVYVDSPILETFDLVDTPGLNSGYNQDDDISKAIAHDGDVVVLLSNYEQFCNGVDFQLLNEVIIALVGRYGEPAVALQRLFVAATKWDRAVQESDGHDDRRAERLFADACKRFAEVRDDFDTSLLRRRMFVTSRQHIAADAALQCPLRNALLRETSEAIPIAILRKCEVAFDDFKKKVAAARTAEITTISRGLESAAVREQKLKVAQAGIKEFRAAKRLYLADVGELLDRIGEDDLPRFLESLKHELSAQALERTVRAKWRSKDAAKEGLPAWVQTHVDRRVSDFVKKRGQQVAKMVEQTLANAQGFFGSENNGESTAFDTGTIDVRGLFLGGIAGAGTLGAVAFWAAGLGNLAGYIIVAKVAGILSTIGISVGGTASLISTIAAFGGPLTWGIGLAVLIGALVWGIFSASWQGILAEKMAKQIEKKMMPKIKNKLRAYIDDTRYAYEEGIKKLDRSLAAAVTEIEEEVKDFNPKRETRRKEALEQAGGWPDANAEEPHLAVVHG